MKTERRKYFLKKISEALNEFIILINGYGYFFSQMELVQSRYVTLHEYWLGTIVLFDLPAVDRTTYAHTCSCARQKGSRGNNTIVRNQCTYSLHRLLSSVLSGRSPATLSQRTLWIWGNCVVHAGCAQQGVLLGPVPLIIQVRGQDCRMLSY